MSLSTRRLFVTILLLSLFALALRPITDPDFWWHLRTGQYILETGLIPHGDIFSFTNSGAEWVTHEWLSEVLIFALSRIGAFPLLIVTFAALIALAFWLVYTRCDGKPYLAGFLTLVGAVATAPTWGVRPQMLSLLLTSIYLVLLDRHRERARFRYLLPLPLLMLIWVNLHSGFAVGLVLLGGYLAGAALVAYRDRIRLTRPLSQLATALGLCLAVIPFNPNGFRMFFYPLETLTSPTMQRYIQEWFSPDLHALEWQPYVLILLGLVAGGILGRVRISIAHLLLLLVFGYASLRSMRHIPIFVLVAIPVLARQWTAILQMSDRTISSSNVRKAPRSLALLNAFILLILVSAAGIRILQVADSQTLAVRAQYPAAAVDYLSGRTGVEKIYNSYAWGGYLIWRLYPQTRVYIDGRADVYGDRFIEHYLAIYRAEPRWNDLLNKDEISVTLIEPDAPLARALAEEPGWTLAWSDKQAVVYTRRLEATAK